MRLLSSVFCCALFASHVSAQWADIKGQVVFPEGKPIPKRVALEVTQDKTHCLSKGDILDEATIVNPKNRGIKNVVVYLRPLDTKSTEFEKTQIHPDDAKRKPAEVVITQPCCMFEKRISVARVGDTLVVKNPAPVAHNFFWSSDNNGEFNITVPKMGEWAMKDPNAAEPRKLVAEARAIQYKCTIHGWMTGYVRIFDHPYFAVTDEDGKFTIKNAPTGKFRIVYWHETGVRGGAEGRFGEPITIAGPTMDTKPVDFEVK
jgi:hypothetical protein